MNAEQRRGAQIVVIALLIISLLSIIRSVTDLTGLATFGTQDEVMREVEAFSKSFAPLRYAGQGANICLMVDLGFESYYSYRIEKGMGGLTITPVAQWDCGGQSDFLLKFNSYEEFQSLAANPSCGAFLAGGRGEQFWYLPSKLWPAGDYPSCNEEFQQKYCSALYYCGEPAELSSALSCCTKEQLTPAQVAMAGASAQAGADANVRKKDSAVLESPLGDTKAFLAWGLGVLIVIAIIIGALFAMQRGKNNGAAEDRAISTIKSYIKMTKDQGFSEGEIASELRRQGWPEDMIDANLNEGMMDTLGVK